MSCGQVFKAFLAVAAAFVVLVVAVAVAGALCGESSAGPGPAAPGSGGALATPGLPVTLPTPTEVPERIHVLELWDAYYGNEARANQVYRGRWMLVSGSIRRIDEQDLEFELGLMAMGIAEARFARDAAGQLLVLEPGTDVELLCRVGGLDLDFLLVLDGCRVEG